MADATPLLDSNPLYGEDRDDADDGEYFRFGISSGNSYRPSYQLGSRRPGSSHPRETMRVNHKFDSGERERLKQFESIDYFPLNSDKYKEWLQRQPSGRAWDRPAMMAAIGVVVGGIGFALYLLIDIIASRRYDITAFLMARNYGFVAWIFKTSTAMLLAAAASWLVVYCAPAASNSGVPEAMAYLNGIHIPKIFNIRTLCVKFTSCVLCVASGLPVGPEGPMIHMGALIGASLSQSSSTTLGIDLQIFKRFRNTRDKRDFVSAGAAVGVATAFHAPLGGLLFVLEEVASFWEVHMQWQVLLACLLATCTLDMLKSAQSFVLEGGHFGLFDQSLTYQISERLTNHLLNLLPALVIGALCGLLAVAFTSASMAFTRLRNRLWGQERWKRVAEVVIIAAVFTTGSFLFPLLAGCREADCTVSWNSHGHQVHSCAGGQEPNQFVEVSVDAFNCRAAPGDEAVRYNELATLMAVTGEDGIKHLFSRVTHRQFGYSALLVHLVWYITGAAIVSGASFASGLFVPMMMIGACVGRLVGLCAADIAAALGDGSEGAPPGVYLTPSPWAWVDPGMFALIGAAGFMGGVTRITVAVIVIMMEMSADVNMLLPISASILTAKSVADALCHPLYSQLLAYQCVPFLEHNTTSSTQSLDLVPVRYVAKSAVVTVRERVRSEGLDRLLSSCSHFGFPVVRPCPLGEVLVGFVARDHLRLLLDRVRQRGAGGAAGITYADLNRQHTEPVAHRAAADAEVQRSSSRVESGLMGTEPGEDEGVGGALIDLQPFISTSQMVVSENFSVERTYVLFRTMGLRHLVVVDEYNRVKGIVTRKDLLGYRLDEAAERAASASMSRMSCELNGIAPESALPDMPDPNPDGGAAF